MTHELHLSSNSESSKNKSLALKAQDSEESKADEEEMAILVRKFKRMMNYKKFYRNKKYASSRNTTCFKCGSKDHFIKDCLLLDGEKVKTKGKEQSKESRVYKPFFTKDNVKKAMIASWGDSDSDSEEDQLSEEAAHLCLMAKTDEKAKLKELESEVWFSQKELRHFSKENLIFVVLEIQEELKELHRAKQ
ncbi:nucleolar protein of 40 kDa-like [Chenopodium quinoa]|uniref:nucleolar protein of 40 kDa-like n=1 Tax=Chenopodium quinoa TaxID=63459 RepID=UPI000B795709|nr:nucleolar protein of 40 kDa-like [Chenopodium quinoa]